MSYLSGAVYKLIAEQSYIGYMQTPWITNVVDLTNIIWGADTGCFTNPDKYDEEEYLAWLRDRLYALNRCLFATAPDIVGDPKATLERSLPVLPLIRDLGFPAALVGQDGLESLKIPWDSFDCLFIGGTTEWKLSEGAYSLAREAKDRGKWIHMGRVNSWRRIKAAAISGYDSVDGTYLVFGPDRNFKRLTRWMSDLRSQSYFIF